MAVFIELVTATVPSLGAGDDGTGAGHTRVRRPLRGLEIKDDTYAYIKLVTADGKSIELVDSSSSTGYSKEYSNFILQSVSEQRAERQQIVETFGDSYMFLFGESPRMLQVQAMLINSFDFNWKAEFEYNYDNYLRGTKSLEKGARCYLFYDENVVEGFIINCAVSQTSQEPLHVQMQFQFYVTGSRNISLIKTDGNYPIRGSVVTHGIDLTTTLDDPTLRQLTQQTVGSQESAFANLGISRTTPLRGKTSSNSDEFTTPIQPSYIDVNDKQATQATSFYNPNDVKKDARDLANALASVLEGYGAALDAAQSPFTANKMGVAPMFVPGGVGVGSGYAQAGMYATFGAVASPGYGFAGMGAGIGAVAGAGFGSFGGAYGALGVGASGGRFQGAGFPSQQSAFANTRTASGIPNTYGGGAGMGLFGSSSPMLNNMSAAELAYVAATGDIFGFSSFMSRAGGQQAAYGYSNNGASSNNRGYAYEQLQASSRAGGYAGAGAYMGYPGYYSYVGASQAGQSGAGAVIGVGGAVSAFSFNSLPGSLSNVDVPPAQLFPYGF